MLVSYTRPVARSFEFTANFKILCSCRNYISQDAALARNLTYANDDTLILRADSTTVLNPSGPGRDSFRLESTRLYDRHVAV